MAGRLDSSPIPSVITLAVTLLRLVGELQRWPSVLFGRQGGGGGSIIGITWLVFVFGAYFALKLSAAGKAPQSPGRAIGYSLVGLVLAMGGAFLAAPVEVNHLSFPGKELVGIALIVAGTILPFRSWPDLAQVLVAYGYSVRIPVLIIMYFSIKGNWDTHYSLGPPGVEFPSFWSKFIQIAVIPQMIFWIAFTIVAGSLAGGITALATRRKSTAVQAA